jgi:hypothetical protein
MLCLDILMPGSWGPVFPTRGIGKLGQLQPPMGGTSWKKSIDFSFLLLSFQYKKVAASFFFAVASMVGVKVDSPQI